MPFKKRTTLTIARCVEIAHFHHTHRGKTLSQAVRIASEQGWVAESVILPKLRAKLREERLEMMRAREEWRHEQLIEDARSHEAAMLAGFQDAGHLDDI